MILTRLKLIDRFDALVDGNHITLSKPDPEVFLMGAKALNLAPEQCLVFEDAQSGIDAANTGGFPRDWNWKHGLFVEGRSGNSRLWTCHLGLTSTPSFNS